MHVPSSLVEESGGEVLPPLFSCAIMFGGAVRIIEIVVIAISTRGGYFDFWLSPRIGSFGTGDLVFGCSCLFLIIAIMGVLNRQRTRSTWVTLLFCVLLLYYCGGLRFFCESLRGGHFVDGLPWGRMF